MTTARLMGQGVIGIRQNDLASLASKPFFSYGLQRDDVSMSVGALGRRRRSGLRLKRFSTRCAAIG
jgi:hypothetical protein